MRAVHSRFTALRNPGVLAAVGGLLLSLLSPAAFSAFEPLDNTISCNNGTPTNGISLGDVAGDDGGASDCWGTYDGNNPSQSGSGFVINGIQYEYVAKQNTPGSLEGDDIGLTVTPSLGALQGDWSYDENKWNPTSFLIVLKASSKPGFGVWLFSGSDAASHSGTWNVAWGHKLSHLSVYESIDGGGGGPPTGTAPEPGILLLLASGLIGIVAARKRH